jgi:chemotaxis protein CheZ
MSTSTQLGATMLNSLAKLREQKGTIRIEDLGEILSEIASAVQPSHNTPEDALRQEFSKIAEHIDLAKLDIASLIHDEEEHIGMSAQPLGHASDNLDAVVKMTEEATNQIMESADKIQQAVDNGGDAMRDIVSNEVTQIYLACSFQDITGQRITKVLSTLEYIDTKVRSILQLFGEISAEDSQKISANRVNNDKRPDAELLNGPQLAAANQDDIDALFASIGN